MSINYKGITQEHIKKLYRYDEDTGDLIVKTSSKLYLLNTVAGTINSRGYTVITINKIKYQAHILIWLYKTGTMPPEGYEIDHKDTVRHNNSWKNLRLATRSENLRNSNLRSDNTTGIKGITFRRNKYDAIITINGKQTLIGHFTTKEEASAALNAAREELHGKFARC